MKKSLVLCAGLCIALAFTGCKPSESAYRKAYDKAKAAEAINNNGIVNTDTEIPVVTPITDTNINNAPVVDNFDNVSVRQENLTVVDGSGLRAYSVVVGSFSVKANAQGLVQTLRNAGYPAQMAYNSDRNMYRVVASTFDNKGDAVRSRNDFRGQYPDAWLLFYGR